MVALALARTSTRSARDRHHSGWQVIETRTGDMSRAHEQFVYSLAYIDAVVLRDRDSDNSAGTGSLGIAGSGLDERLYFQQEREFNVTAVIDTAGVVKERYCYDPYGSRQILKDDWTIQGSSSYANNVGFTGRWHDVTGMIYMRCRYYEPVLGRFVSRDPWTLYQNGGVWQSGPGSGYPDGMNTYAAYFTPNDVDPTGLKICIGKARVLKGNKAHIGKPGGFSGTDPIPVKDGSAAVDPRQWGDGTKSSLRPFIGGISGTFTDDKGSSVGSFSGVSEVIGGQLDKRTGDKPSDKLEKLNPNTLLLELPSAAEDLGVVDVTLTVPDTCPCPKGTTEKPVAGPAGPAAPAAPAGK